jgi:hypothetical protein
MGAHPGKAKRGGGGHKATFNADRFRTYGELQDGLRKAGLESSNLVVAVDFTKVYSRSRCCIFGVFVLTC